MQSAASTLHIDSKVSVVVTLVSVAILAFFIFIYIWKKYLAQSHECTSID